MSDDILHELIQIGYKHVTTFYEGRLKIRLLQAPEGTTPRMTKLFELG